MKKCADCQQILSLDKFYKKKDKLDYRCKDCNREYDRKRCRNHNGPKSTGTKTCTECKNIKDVSEFSKRLRSKDGLRNRCKMCDRAKEHKYRKETNPKQQIYARVKLKYGLTKEQYDDMFIKQDSKCKICQASNQKLVVDHCHNTNIVRGLLCNNCNAGLGMFRDDVDIINKAIQYLIDGRI